MFDSRSPLGRGLSPSGFDKVDAICRKLRNKLISEYEVTAEPFSDFIREVNSLADGGMAMQQQ